MRKSFYYSVVFLMSAMLLTSCDEKDNPSQAEGGSISLSPVQKKMVVNCNDFAFDMFRQLDGPAAATGGSSVFSPVSVMCTLGLVNAGAEGETGSEIVRALGYENGDTQSINGLCHTLMTQAPVVDPQADLRMANCLVFNRALGTYVESDYMNDAQSYYLAGIFDMDFKSSGTLDFINEWCDLHTAGMIPKIIDRLEPSDPLALMNAVYFKARWKRLFMTEKTEMKAFTPEGGKSKRIPMMNNTGEYDYTQNDTYATLKLEYGRNGKWSMYVLLPNKGKALADVISSLTADSWKENVAGMNSRQVDVRLPRFRTDTEYDLKQTLQAMGVKSMFDPEKADFSKLSKEQQLFIGLIRQKAAINVSENGTEAAAATYVGWLTEDYDPETVVFHANHPFLYLIQESDSGAIFFIGTFRGE